MLKFFFTINFTRYKVINIIIVSISKLRFWKTLSNPLVSNAKAIITTNSIILITQIAWIF